jgi:hypothetical protein
MPVEGSAFAFNIVNTSGLAKTFYWYIRELSGDIRWTDFDAIGLYTFPNFTIKGSQLVGGGLTAQVPLDFKIDTLVEDEESFEVVVSEVELTSSDIPFSPAVAAYTIQDATRADIFTQTSGAYSRSVQTIQDYDIPGGGSLNPTDFNWRSVNRSELFYVSPNAVVLNRGGQGNPLYFELALRDSGQNLRREYESQEVKPIAVTYDNLIVREATADVEGSIYAIVSGYEDDYLSSRDFLVKISNTGAVVFTKDLYEVGPFRTFQALYNDGFGGVIVCSYADEPYPMPRIDKYDAQTGDMLWSEKPLLGMATGSIRMSERPIQLLADGTFLLGISGYVGIEDPAYATYIIRMNLESGASTHMLGIDGDNTYFQNEFIETGSQVFYRTNLGVYEVNTGTIPKSFSYPLSSYIPPWSGGNTAVPSSGSGGSSSTPIQTPINSRTSQQPSTRPENGGNQDQSETPVIQRSYSRSDPPDPITEFKPGSSVLSIDSSAFGIEDDKIVDFKAIKSIKSGRLLKKFLKSDFNIIYEGKTGYVYLNANREGPGFGPGGGLIAVLDPRMNLSDENFQLL